MFFYIYIDKTGAYKFKIKKSVKKCQKVSKNGLKLLIIQCFYHEPIVSLGFISKMTMGWNW